MESVLDLKPAAVPSAVAQVSCVLDGVFLLRLWMLWGSEVERLGVASLYPGPVDVYVGTTATVLNDCIPTAAGPVDVAKETEVGCVD